MAGGLMTGRGSRPRTPPPRRWAPRNTATRCSAPCARCCAAVS
ncbi:hypothetical protein QJS66_15490 [Kocuria rhizophila]|nr:hypothetical protein QJS66_15490 [Kocuria rhizophila]